MSDLETIHSKDLPTRHEWKVGKNTLRMECHDPYGFYTFSFERGNLPPSLHGQFSSLYRGFQAVNLYLAGRKDDNDSV